MNKSPKWLEEILDTKLEPLDRRPFLVSAILTSSIMIAASYGGTSFAKIASLLWPKVEWTINHWPLLLVGLLCITALLLDFIISWVQTTIKRLWWHIPLLVFLLVVICVIFSIGGECSRAKAWIFAPLIYLLIVALRFEPRHPLFAVSDSLHRKYLVERVAEVIKDADHAPRRIAIQGSWGIGKTAFLRMLWAELSKSQTTTFHMAWVNPWRTQTPEQAWAAIAKAVDYALGNRPAFPRDWVNHPVLVWLLGLIPSAKITPKLVDYFANDVIQMPESTALQFINRNISSRVGKNGRLIIFIDDMERADPKVIRSILPVIDRLSELDHSLFLFAIDPKRIAEAYEEKEQNAPLTKGYLDKIFDLQIPLPEPDQADILKLLLEKATRENLSFLSSVLPNLAHHLPSNPRTALRFFEVAKTRERMFFGRYHPTEIPEVPFFLCWLIETEFPGFMKAINLPANLKLFNTVCEAPLMEQKQPSAHQDFKGLIESIGNELGLTDDTKTESTHLYKVVASLAEMSGNSLNWITGQSTLFTLDWIASGHTRLEQLTIPELLKLRDRWSEWAGKKTLEEMLRDEFGTADFCDANRCGEQLIDAEIKLITSACSTALGAKNVANAFTSISKRIDLLTEHLRFSRTSNGRDDLPKFNKVVFYRWLHFFMEVPLNRNSFQSVKEVDDSRIRFHEELALALPYEDALRAVWWDIRNETDMPHDLAHRAELESHCSHLKHVLLTNASAELLSMFRDGRIATINGNRVQRNWPPTALPSQELHLFLDPRSWISTENDAWRAPLESLVTDAVENQNIAAACAEIVGAYVIHPAACSQCVDGHVRDRQLIHDITNQYPGYFRYFWEAAMRLDSDLYDYNRLIRERKKAENAGFFEPEFLTVNFPLPPNHNVE